MARAMLRVTAACGLGLSLAACGSGQPQVAVERTEWLVSDRATGARFTVSAYVGGSTCIDFDRVEVEERDDVVEVAAYVRRAVDQPCSEDFGWRDVVVELEASLGDRELVGCAGEQVTVRGWNLDPDTDCAVPPQGWPPHEVWLRTPPPGPASLAPLSGSHIRSPASASRTGVNACPGQEVRPRRCAGVRRGFASAWLVH